MHARSTLLLLCSALLATLVARSAAQQESSIVKLTKFNFNNNVKSGVWFVKFYAPWCTHCQRIAPMWEKLADQVATKELPLKIAEVDCTSSKEVCEKVQVKAFPLLMLIKNGELLDKYQGEASVANFEEWLSKKVPEGGSGGAGPAGTIDVTGSSGGSSKAAQTSLFYAISTVAYKTLVQFPTKSKIINLYFYGFLVVGLMVAGIAWAFKFVEEEDSGEADPDKRD